MGMRFGGGDRWMDSPKWNKSGAETYNDWDNRGKGFEDANNRYMSILAFSCHMYIYVSVKICYSIKK